MVEAKTYSEGEIGSQFIESADSDSAEALSSHRRPIVKKKPIKKIGTPPNIVSTIWPMSAGLAPAAFRKETVAVPKPTPAANIIEPISAMRIGRLVMLLERKLRLVLRRRESIRILANWISTLILISGEPQQYPRRLWYPSV